MNSAYLRSICKISYIWQHVVSNDNVLQLEISLLSLASKDFITLKYKDHDRVNVIAVIHQDKTSLSVQIQTLKVYS